MNSPPKRRYRTASAPITPISESALDMGWVCTTRLMAQMTAIAAKIRKRRESMSLCKGHRERGHQEVHQRDGKHEGPGESHELVIAETGQRRAHPDKHEQDRADLRNKPEQRHEDKL